MSYRSKNRAIRRLARKPRPPTPGELRDDYAKSRTFHRETHADRLRDALDPAKAPSKVKSFKDMTPEERAEMERLYGGKK